MTIRRCAWCTDDPLYQGYHDQEWGIPIYDEVKLFECLILEGVQAGLSWLTVLKKRDHYRAAYRKFDINYMASLTDDDIARQVQDKGLIRHRGKLQAARSNAQAILALKSAHLDVVEYLWSFVAGQPKLNHYPHLDAVPSSTQESDAMAKALKKQGFKFVGSTICYAFMQATGMVNDHTQDCFLYHDR